MQKPNCQRTKNVSWPHVSSHEAGGNFILPLGRVLRRCRSDEILAQHSAHVNSDFENIFSAPRADRFPRRGIGFPDEKNIFYFVAPRAERGAGTLRFSRARRFPRAGSRPFFGERSEVTRSAGKIDGFSPTRHWMIIDGLQRRQKTSDRYGTSEMSGRGDNLSVERSYAGRITSRGAASEASFIARAFHMKLEMSTTNFLSGRASSKMLS